MSHRPHTTNTPQTKTMIWEPYTTPNGSYDPNDWLVDRDEDTITIICDGLMLWQLTDRGESDDAAINAAIVSTIVDYWGH